jgi:hypothetical protein
VVCAYRDLAKVWADARARERRSVAPDEALMKMETVLDLPLREAWGLLQDEDTWQRMTGARAVNLLPGAKGGLADGELHCHHGAGAPMVMRVVLADEPHTMTMTCEPGIVSEMWQTFHMEELDGRTRLTEAVAWNRWPGPAGLAKHLMFKAIMNRSLASHRRGWDEAASRRREMASANLVV